MKKQIVSTVVCLSSIIFSGLLQAQEKEICQIGQVCRYSVVNFSPRLITVPNMQPGRLYHCEFSMNRPSHSTPTVFQGGVGGITPHGRVTVSNYNGAIPIHLPPAIATVDTRGLTAPVDMNLGVQHAWDGQKTSYVNMVCVPK